MTYSMTRGKVTGLIHHCRKPSEMMITLTMPICVKQSVVMFTNTVIVKLFHLSGIVSCSSIVRMGPNSLMSSPIQGSMIRDRIRAHSAEVVVT